MGHLRSRAATAWIQAVAGFAAAWLAGNLFCKLPASHHLSGRAVLLLATEYVLLTLVAGIAQVWALRALFKRKYEFKSSTLIFHAGAAWLLVAPATVLLERESLWMAALMISGAVLMTIGLRRMVPALAAMRTAPEAALFSGPLQPEPWPWLAFGLSLGVYSGLFGILHIRFLFDAGLLLAVCMAVFLWRMTAVHVREGVEADSRRAPAALQIMIVVAVAILLTAWTLLPWVYRPNNLSAGAGAHPRPAQSPKEARGEADSLAYRGIILWTIAPKKKEVFIAPSPSSMEAGSKAKRFVIPFDGPYWYYQLPASSPGAKAHQAYGSPVNVNIRANDLFPLLMEAHQNLGTSIDLSCCREIRVEIQNGDNRPGEIQLGLLLTDTTEPGKPSQYLGMEPVASSLPDHFSIKPSPVSETLRFPVPAQPKIRRFNAITVVFMPASVRSIVGAKVSIQQFEMIPR
jgi:hypothetical protein